MVRPATVRLRPNPGQRNGKNLCRSHPRTRESLDPSIARFQEQLNLILDELHRNFPSRCGRTHPFLGQDPGFRLVFGALAELASEPSATRRRGDAMRHKGERCAVVNLTRLHFDGVRQVHGTLHQLSNRHVLSVLHVPREDTGLQPFRVPGVFNGDNRIRSRNHAQEREASI